MSSTNFQKKAHLCFWKDFTFREFSTGDQISSLTIAESEIDDRLHEALEMKDPDIIVDLCELNKGQSSKFTSFWEKMKVFLNESSAVHER